MSPQSHKCYKSLEESSSAMEKDIIVEGFKHSETMHGIRCTGLIGDGDSSVHKSIVDTVPIYGRRVKKIECTNHAIRCYRKSVHDLVEANSEWKGRNGLSKMKIKKIAAGARATIRMYSVTGNVDALRRDLRNTFPTCLAITEIAALHFAKSNRLQLLGTVTYF